ncbi:phage head-tail connector protein [Paucilactobacillus sp. N302-9]
MAESNQPVALDELKTWLGLNNTNSDKLLTLIISKTVSYTRFKLGLKKGELFPEEVSFIPFDVCVKRYNRRANEGMASYSQEGESITFNNNDFDEYEDAIEQWRKDNGKNATSLGTIQFRNAYEGE